MKEHYPFVNPPLPYGYDALEPFIDAQTMHLHHDKHLQGYTDNLNAALRDHPNLQCMTLEQLISIACKLPENIGTPIARNAGGVYNHRFYFDGMSSYGIRQPVGELQSAIDSSFGSFEEFHKKFAAAAMSVFGSGYAWLVANKCGMLNIVTTPNQETPSLNTWRPILNIDVWEHAYYLKHYNKRADYIEDWFGVANWFEAHDRYICENR